LVIIGWFDAVATHNRAGEITYTQISELTYEITVTTYTYTLSNVDREELEVEWGDGTYTIVPRHDLLELPDYYQRNRYIARHTFPGPGIYVVLVQDPNRNFGVENIPNSVNTVFSVKTTIFVNPELGSNNTPILLNPPINQAAQYRTFLHNPGAYDINGDSLSYSLASCTGENGEAISGYTLPPATTSIGINEITGDLIWDTPPDTGKYNLAIQIDEWRSGVKIGSVVRDMQIDVYPTENHPPEVDSLGEICVLVGDTANVLIRSTDIDLNNIEHSATGGPFLFENNFATIEEVSSVPGETISRFIWETECNHIRKDPYMVIISARDDHPDVKLVGIQRLLVKVIGPAPYGLEVEPGNAFIRLNWSASDCEPSKFLIYRKIGSLDYVHDSCTTGLPEESGYEFVGETEDTAYVDNDNGEGLVQGFDYCYRIVAEYEDGAQSYPSEEQCTSIAPGYPIITNVSVLNTDFTNGEIMVRWDRPDRLDTVPGAVGPFKYIIYRSDDEFGMRLRKIDSISGLDDTTYYDTQELNTEEVQYSYEIALYNDAPGNRFKIGIPQLASSIFLDLIPGDNQVEINIKKNTAWLDNEYVVYRLNNTTAQYDSIAYTTNRIYTDTKLNNGDESCYKVKSIGTYKINDIEHPTINWSHENCQTPEDYQRPCPPSLDVRSSCDSLKNVLTWNNPNLSCADDVIAYKVYFTNNAEQSLDSISRIEGAENIIFEHDIEAAGLESLGGCYAVAAVDSFNNESELSFIRCVDNCSYYLLPNVFSPNGDGVNDVYVADNPLEYVKDVDMRIFNRWGELVYQTNNPLIEWDGKEKNSNKIVASGVYYYICDVWEPRISGLELRNVVGFIHVFTGGSTGEFSNE
ncbi:gliding motility-associated C-terminal domain-containing protein, partial [Bacteroidota bacterium]